MRATMTTLGMAALATCLVLPASAQDRIAYGTTNPESSTYTYGVSAAKAINTVSGDEVQVTVVATGGAVDNLGRLARGQIQLGLGNMASVYQAYEGIGRFEGNPAPKLRGLWLYQRSLQPHVVREDAGIGSLEELEGESFSPGLRGSATESLVMQTFDVLGIKPDWYRASLPDALEAIKEGRAVGYVKAMQGRSLDSATMELATTTPVKVLSFTEEQAASVQEALPYLTFVTVGEDEISGVNGFRTWASFSGHYTYSDVLEPEQVAAILEGIVDGKQHQEEVWPPLRGVDVVAMTLEGMNIPLHAGAVEFYRSRGYDVPEALIPPEMK